MSAGIEKKKAIAKATDYINNNFRLEDTFFVPKNYDNKRLSEKHIDFVIEKANIIKISVPGNL